MDHLAAFSPVPQSAFRTSRFSRCLFRVLALPSRDVKVSVVTPNFNGARFLEAALRSVIAQRGHGVEVEYIVADGGSTDDSPAILARHRGDIDVLICGPDTGPANAVNKGFAAATGDIVAWLNADDVYQPGALTRVIAAMERHPAKALAFGHCPIMDEAGAEIRQPITLFKEMFFPFSCGFTIQCINYVSQPATFFRREAALRAGPLREDLKAAWDYDFILRVWRHGGAVRIGRPPLAAFRWHEASISGSHFARQFREEYLVAKADAGCCAPQTIAHWFVRWGIVCIYSLMARSRAARKPGARA
jgi:GT2 family glycosyltransferase